MYFDERTGRWVPTIVGPRPVPLPGLTSTDPIGRIIDNPSGPPTPNVNLEGPGAPPPVRPTSFKDSFRIAAAGLNVEAPRPPAQLPFRPNAAYQLGNFLQGAMAGFSQAARGRQEKAAGERGEAREERRIRLAEAQAESERQDRLLTQEHNRRLFNISIHEKVNALMKPLERLGLLPQEMGILRSAVMSVYKGIADGETTDDNVYDLFTRVASISGMADNVPPAAASLYFQVKKGLMDKAKTDNPNFDQDKVTLDALHKTLETMGKGVLDQTLDASIQYEINKLKLDQIQKGAISPDLAFQAVSQDKSATLSAVTSLLGRIASLEGRSDLGWIGEALGSPEGLDMAQSALGAAKGRTPQGDKLIALARDLVKQLDMQTAWQNTLYARSELPQMGIGSDPPPPPPPTNEVLSPPPLPYPRPGPETRGLGRETAWTKGASKVWGVTGGLLGSGMEAIQTWARSDVFGKGSVDKMTDVVSLGWKAFQDPMGKKSPFMQASAKDMEGKSPNYWLDRLAAEIPALPGGVNAKGETVDVTNHEDKKAALRQMYEVYRASGALDEFFSFLMYLGVANEEQWTNIMRGARENDLPNPGSVAEGLINWNAAGRPKGRGVIKD